MKLLAIACIFNGFAIMMLSLGLINAKDRIRALERQEQATPEPKVQLRPAFRIREGTQPAPSGLKLAAN